jgi:hypothetical protein
LNESPAAMQGFFILNRLLIPISGNKTPLCLFTGINVSLMDLHLHFDKLVINVTAEKIDQLLELVLDNNKYLKHIAMKQKELIPIVQEIATQLGKVKSEVDALFTKSQQDPDADPELVSAIQSIKSGLQSIDDIIPDTAPGTDTGTGAATDTTVPPVGDQPAQG